MSIIFNQKKNVSQYIDRHLDDDLTERQMTNEYYDLATDFYEYGWGQSFHFATRWKGESLAESIARHEHFLASKLQLKAGHQVADLGMGVGGPLRSVVKFSHANVTGVTINDYQIRRAKKLTKQRESPELAKLMHYRQGDFTKLVPHVFQEQSLDAIYYIESSCHISNRTEVFLEGARTLKPGGRFFAYEWVMTDHYDENNETHRDVKAAVEWGNGIEKLISARSALKSVEDAGLRVIEHGDLVDIAEETYGAHNVPWYYDMAQYFAFSSMSAFQLSDFGQYWLSYLLAFVAKIGLVPKDALDTEQMLVKGKKGLVTGGKMKIFTPMYYIVAEKPL
jgi:sterol 24-C-methyltransferase